MTAGHVPPPPEGLAAEHQTRAGVPSDEEVDRLSAAVDSAFAERDRLWAHARATGRDEDDQAMLRQDEHAAQLLDQYTVAVREQMAEVERRRAENIARYRSERDEPWMNGRDAARSLLPPPPAAEPYVPPKRTPTNGSTGGAGMPSNIEEARAGIMSAHSTGESAVAALGQAYDLVQDTANAFQQAAEGSNQSEVDQAHGQLAEAMNKIAEAQDQVAAALQEFEGVGQRL